MTDRLRRRIGAGLLLAALAALVFLLPPLAASRYSQTGFTIMKRPAIKRLALGYLVAGMAAGFGLALLVWPRHR